MKKLILIATFFLVSGICFAQTFVKKYTSVISEISGVVGDWKDISLTVVFNEQETGDIVFYYSDGYKRRFHQVSSVTEDKTNSGQGYQIIICIDSEDATKVALQLFDSDTVLRVLISKDTYVEFHR